MKTLKFGLLLAAAMLAGVGVGNAQQTSFKATGTGASPPSNFVASNTTNQQGIVVDLVNAIAADAGFSIEYVQPVPFGDLMPALLDKRIDIIASAFSARSAAGGPPGIAATIPYAISGEGLWIQKTDAVAYRSLEDLRGQAVGAVGGSSHLKVLEAMAGTFSEVRSYPTSTDLAHAVISGEVKAGLTNGGIAAYRALHDFPELTLPSTWQMTMPDPQTLGVRQVDTELLGKLNVSLAKLIADGSVERIFAKYGVSWIRPI